jgi:HD-like signal output (HDOD) protein/CheY-like chemotaxis protein
LAMKMLLLRRFMSTKSILLAVTETQALEEINGALGSEWETIPVASEEDALALLEQRSFDALLVDFNLGSPDASELLNRSLEMRPETSRFLLAHESDLALVAAKVLGSHHILPKPVEPASLKSRIENGVNDSNPTQGSKDPAPDAGAARTIPPVYFEVLNALDLPGVTNKQVGEIIARDAALTAEVLRLTRSAYMGLPRNLTDPAEAVESLGLETVKALVMALRFLAERSDLKPGYLSVEKTWQHSINVAQLARDLVLFETKDRALASQALAAGLLHDLGKLVLATNFDDLYGRVHSLARKQPVPLWEIEKEMFGANHGEIGGCLVGMWNLPLPIVEAVAFHHEPPLGESNRLTPLAAIHIANVLEYQLRPSDEFRVAPVVNTAFLNELGLLQRLPVWRARSVNLGNVNRKSQPAMAEAEKAGSTMLVIENTPSSRTGNHLPGPVAATETATSGQPVEESRESVPAPRSFPRRWVYAGLAVGVLFLLAIWPRTQPDLSEVTPVYARTTAAQPEPAVASNTSPETVPAAMPEVTPPAVVSKAALASDTAPASQPAIPRPAPEPAPEVVSPAAVVANVPPPSLPPGEEAVPDFRLSGIIYGVTHPSAIVNGKTVYVGEKVGGGTVISIGQTEVTLQVNGVRRTCALP